MPVIDTLTIAQRFNGPPQSSNGGWAGGLLAKRFGSALPSVSVSLKAPPPLAVVLEVHQHDDQSLSLHHGELELARAWPENFDLVMPSFPGLPGAQAASAAGLQRDQSRASWPYSKCFACGVSRQDGLCITPGPLEEGRSDGAIAALWTPPVWLAEGEGKVSVQGTWAALDCPAGIAWSYRLPEGSPMVTVRMSVMIRELPEVGQPCVILGWPILQEGRKLHAGTALFDAHGKLLASSRQLWLIPRAAT